MEKPKNEIDFYSVALNKNIETSLIYSAIHWLIFFVVLVIPYFFLQYEIYALGIFAESSLINLIIKSGIYGSLLPALVTLILCTRFRYAIAINFITWSMVSFVIVLLVVVNIYMGYFRDIPHVNLLFRGEEAWAIRGQFFHQLANAQTVISLLFGFLAILMISRFQGLVRPQSGHRFRVIGLSIASIALVLNLVLQLVQHNRTISSDLYKQDKVLLARMHGLSYVYYYMIKGIIFKVPRTYVGYPGSINETKTSNHSKNSPITIGSPIIILQVESLDSHVLGLKVNNKEVTPFLNRLRSKSVYFDNFIAQHSGGGSSDAELSALTSLLPLSSHAGLQTADYAKIVSLAEVLKNNGYSTFAMHGNTGSFYQRMTYYPKLGFDKFFDVASYSGDAKGWESRDDAFLNQSADIITSQSAPFFVYIITQQGHGPFNNHHKKTLRSFDFSDTSFSDNQRSYIATFHEIDNAISNFFSRLRSHDYLKNSLVILYSDHLSNIWPRDRLFEKVPLLINHPDLDPQRISSPGSHLDIAPTVLSLLGIREDLNWIGSPLLPAAPGKQVLLNNRYVIDLKQDELDVRFDNNYIDYINYSIYLLD